MEICRSDFHDNSVTFTTVKQKTNIRISSTLAVLATIVAAVSIYCGHLSGSTTTSLATLVLGVFLTFPKTRVISESVMAVRGVGLQLTCTFSDGSERHTLIPQQDIEDIVINEAPAGFIIRTYLVVVGKKGKNFLPFENTGLKIKTSAEILFVLRQVLFDEKPDFDISS